MGDDCCWRLYQRNARDKDPGTRWRTYGFSWKWGTGLLCMSGSGFERDGAYIKTSPGCCHLFRSIFPRAELSRGEAEASSRTRFFEGCKDESFYSWKWALPDWTSGGMAIFSYKCIGKGKSCYFGRSQCISLSGCSYGFHSAGNLWSSHSDASGKKYGCSSWDKRFTQSLL